ncbi:hypothetical protein B0T26DRAFT_126845 [Lasiosphaeria miniovina]|uniref:Uncharacterized protein n=1 Tax=Lasiosphaeria miniovina TaxID=1954250 RepID=A0AA40B401_9PEZI|nr:uncharacterized protein B0T26DRAFT_126845 [Lasiosphaeria miniovina]KAK0727273.1 hypothetical protein B0T26DRAFT_126845 [Lasiosphaeria miniovina]
MRRAQARAATFIPTCPLLAVFPRILWPKNRYSCGPPVYLTCTASKRLQERSRWVCEMPLTCFCLADSFFPNSNYTCITNPRFCPSPLAGGVAQSRGHPKAVLSQQQPGRKAKTNPTWCFIWHLSTVPQVCTVHALPKADARVSPSDPSISFISSPVPTYQHKNTPSAIRRPRSASIAAALGLGLVKQPQLPIRQGSRSNWAADLTESWRRVPTYYFTNLASPCNPIGPGHRRALLFLTAVALRCVPV